MVGTLSLVFMAVTLIICLGLPIAAVIYCYKKWKISIAAVFTGAGIFVFFQLLTRIPLIGILSTFQWFRDFTNNAIPYAFLLALSAGIFEEIGRFIGFRLFLRKKLEWKNGVAYGIGHGGIEAILLVGISYIGNIVYSIMINSGIYDTIVAPALTSETSEILKSQLIGTPPELFLMAGIERVFVITIHIALSLIVLYGIMNKKNIYLFYAVLFHTILNFAATLLGLVNIWVSELFILVFAVAGAVFIVKSHIFDSLKPEANPYLQNDESPLLD